MNLNKLVPQEQPQELPANEALMVAGMFLDRWAPAAAEPDLNLLFALAEMLDRVMMLSYAAAVEDVLAKAMAEPSLN